MAQAAPTSLDRPLGDDMLSHTVDDQVLIERLESHLGISDGHYCEKCDLQEYKDDVDYIKKEAQLEKRIRDHEDLVKRQREEYNLLLQELQNREEKLQSQPMMQNEKEKRLTMLQAQWKRRINDHQDLERRQKDELQWQLEHLQNMKYKQQRQQAILDEKEKSLRLLQDLLPPLSLGPASSSWQMPGWCWDVAVTSEGHVLVAAGAKGLKELDVTGKELSSWQPKEADDSVSTVDVLEDSRIAVGVHGLKLIVLLQRALAEGSGWAESKVISVLQSPPRRLAVHADLLAVCEGRLNSDTNRWVCGSWLVLAQLSSGQEMHRHKLDYDIGSVALTARIVVTCSDSQVKLADGSEKYVVDGHSHSGMRLWRHVPCNIHPPYNGIRAMDVCFAESRRILYLCLTNHYGILGNKITAVSADTGEHIKDVVACSRHGLYSLSMDREKQRFFVVLSSDEKDVPCKLAVYPVSSSI